MLLQGMPGRDTLFVVQIMVEAGTRSPYNYKLKPCKTFQGLKTFIGYAPASTGA
jgi:hypothetical protein